MEGFIAGQADIDKSWDKYLSTLQEIGIDEFVDIHQRAYDEKYK